MPISSRITPDTTIPKGLAYCQVLPSPKPWDLFVLSHGITLVWDDFLLKTPHVLLVEHLSRLLLFQIYIFFLLQMIIKQICNYPGLLCILSRDRYYLNPGHSGAPFLSRNTTDCSEITLACSLTKSWHSDSMRPPVFPRTPMTFFLHVKQRSHW